jgi:hypothetical protein
LTCEFEYDEDYPLIVMITQDYAEGYPNEFSVSFDSLKIYESTNQLVDMKCHHIEPMANSIGTTGEAEITLDAFTSSNTFTFSKFHREEDDLDDDDITYGNNQSEAVSGICVKLDVIETGDVTLLATLRNDKSSIGQRSIIGFHLETIRMLVQWSYSIFSRTISRRPSFVSLTSAHLRRI